MKNVNEVLNLVGSYTPKDNESAGGPKNLKKNKFLEVKKILDIRDQLIRARDEWSKIDTIRGMVINVQYNCVVPKSSRISFLLREYGKNDSQHIVGARFIDGHHNISYYISQRSAINDSITILNEAYKFCASHFDKRIAKENFNIDKNRVDPVDYSDLSFTSRSNFRKLIVELSDIDKIEMPNYKPTIKSGSKIISFFETDKTGNEICNNLLIDKGENSIIQKLDEKGNLLLVDENTFDLIVAKVPYLICDSTTDLLSITSEMCDVENNPINIQLPKNPSDEPIIGVIDSRFDSHVYFSNWVEYVDDYYDGEFEPEDYHGTEVDSILVNGSEINGDRFDDGCGYFRVVHFHLASKNNGIPSNILIERIKEIVTKYPSIHVWNLCLGSDNQIDDNYISFEAEILDKLQYLNKNLVFVISGTNMPEDLKQENYKIGSPADSINSIVVNSVDKNGNIPNYARKGGVLSFFNKPDFATFGGSSSMGVRVCNPAGENFKQGTSFAAPWISRKMCYLMEKMHLTREAAKALLIDSAAGWNYSQNEKDYKGYGIVPTNIKDILKTDSDEIRFILSGYTLAYKTYNYNLPIPLNSNDRYPFIARATLCYFPSCDRKQGVDYTETEMSVKFGRMKNGAIDDINSNVQDEEGSYITEDAARKYQRKWDNVKFISMQLKDRLTSLKSYDNKMWGVSITSKQRNSTTVTPLPFSVVVTLKEIEGKNRIESFIEQCSARGWQVEKINIENNNNLFQRAQEELLFDDDFYNKK